jgi:hypothetical protein
MKFDLQKFGAPLGIAAAILAIWVYLRGKSNPTQAIVNNPATSVHGVGTPIPGLSQVLFQPGYGGGVGGPPQAQPGIVNTIAASANPISPTANAPVVQIPGYLTYNFGPQFAFSKLPVAQYMADQQMMAKPGGGCGCGGSCGDTKSCNTSCVSSCDVNNLRYPDGRGGCLTGKVSQSLIQKTSFNLAGYAASESIVPTAPILGYAVPA